MPPHTDSVLYLAAFCLGAVSGMRTFLAPAAIACALWMRPQLAPVSASVSAPGRWLATPAIALVLIALALGELVADKLPNTPNRIAPGPLVARLVSGGVCGTTIAQIGGVSVARGAWIGAIGALVAAFAAFHARRSAGRATGIRDPYFGALEDLIALALAGTTLATIVMG